MADNNNLLGVQTVTDDVLSNNDVLSHNDASTNTDVEVEVEIEDSGNDNSDNSVNDSGNLGIADSGNDNSDNSVNDSGNLGIADSGNDNSVDNSDNSVDNSNELDVDLEVEIEDSFNDNSDNSVNTDFDDSFNEDDSVRNTDSFNITSSFNTQTLNDDSTSIGIRQYNTGFGDLNLGGLTGMAAGKSYGHGGGAGGVDIDIDNRSMQLDQSVSQIVEAGNGGGVDQVFAQEATVAFGDGSMAAGDDLTVVDTRFDIEMGDISIGNTWIDTRINDSFQDNSVSNEWEMEVEIEDSFNDESTQTDIDVEIEDSFTSEVDATFENSWEWENEGNIFSPGAATTGGETDIEFD